MAELLFLAHRLPYPPNKGDKVRSWHLLKHLAARHRVHLGTFVDDPDDLQHLGRLRELCASLHFSRLHPRRAKLASLAGLLRGEPLTLAYYRDAALQAWVQRLGDGGRLDGALVFSSSMAPYAQRLKVPLWVDFVDVDSAKWTQYAPRHRWPLSWLYRREGRELLAFERSVAALAEHSFFATEKEAELFRGLAPECAGRVAAVCNGVDFEYFTARDDRASPYAADELPVVFTGAMDYWPNIDAVSWFVAEMLPPLRQRWPQLRFHIVGRGPAPAVRALAGDAVNVTGTVDDVRPWLQHAAAVVAPLRLARGVQNKVLEAMAMGRPVVAAAACAEAIDATPGRHLLAAETAAEYVHALGQLLAHPAQARQIGQAGRLQVEHACGWDAQLKALDLHLLPRLGSAAAGESRPASATLQA
jgi:sugar transferase (PEP-CTERM/EpsH1 system associated)